jgi:hypothetical protein
MICENAVLAFCLSSCIGALEYQKIFGITAEQFEFYMDKVQVLFKYAAEVLSGVA